MPTAKRTTAKQRATAKKTTAKRATKPGDFILIDSAKVGSPPREGEVLKIIQGVGVSYWVRWADGHQSFIMPKGSPVHIVPASEGLERHPVCPEPSVTRPMTTPQRPQCHGHAADTPVDLIDLVEERVEAGSAEDADANRLTPAPVRVADPPDGGGPVKLTR